MKRCFGVMLALLLAVPAFAQDDFFGGDVYLSNSEIDALLGGGRGRNNRGRGGNNIQLPDPISLFAQIKDLLKSNKVPLEKSQEKPLQALLDTESKAIRASIEEQFSNRGNNNNQSNRGNSNNNSNFITRIEAVVVKHNGELWGQIKPDLTPDQTALLAKAEKDKKVCLVLLDVVNFNNNNNFNNSGGRGGFPNNDMSRELGERPRCTSGDSSLAQRLAPLGNILSKGKKPLTPEQEKKFSGLIESRIPLMREDMRAQDLPVDQIFNQNRNNNNNNQNNNNTPQQMVNNVVNTILTQLGIPTNTNNNNSNNRGRGGNPGNQNPAAGNTNAPAGGGTNAANVGSTSPAGVSTPTAANTNAPAAGSTPTAAANTNPSGNPPNNNRNFNPQAEVQKKNEELLDKIAASLKPDQHAVVKKFKYAEIKKKGGIERIRGILEEEGTPLTPEQTTQIQRLFNSENTSVREFAQGLVQAEVQKLPPVTPFEPTSGQQQNPQQNRNSTNVNQNSQLQEIVAKVLPQVSIRRAGMEKLTMDTILSRVLTPSQVASYKLSSM